MAIALTCPSCERALKVKDELAGRKIKCPGCGSVITVMGEEADAKTPVVRKKSAVERDDEVVDKDKRPKKKKKRKAQGKRGLLIGGGAALVAMIGAVILFLVMGGGSAKEKVAVKRPEPKVATEPVANTQPVEDPPQVEKKAPAGTAARVREGTVVRNVLRQLGIAYRNFEALENRGPKNQKELAPYYENSGEINEYLTKNWVTFIWGAPRQSFAESGASNTVLAYETDPDRQGIRIALFGDGSVRDLDENEFSKAPKAKGKQ